MQVLTPPADPLAGTEAGPLYQQAFVAHTGQDEAARVFTNSILKPTLEAAGLTVFVDWLSVEPGGMWASQIEDAAINSCVFVAGMSVGFVRRFWCMHELDLALHGRPDAAQQRPLLVPVYFDPEDRIIAEAACWKSAGLPPERQAVADADRWQQNVAQLGHLKHFRRSSYTSALSYKGTDEAALAHDVVQAVVRLIPPQADVGTAVGLEQQAEALLEVLQRREKLGVWLHGCGGAGKSTLARLLFNRLAGHFADRAMVVLQPSDGPPELESHVSKILQGLGVTVASGRVLPQLLVCLAARKPALVLLDGVWTPEQLDMLLPANWAEGSIVIVSSRAQEMPGSQVWRQVSSRLHQHQMQPLGPAAASSVLRTAACLGDSCMPVSSGADSVACSSNGTRALKLGSKRIEAAEAAILAFCEGLPLALQLAGASLQGAALPTDWEAVLSALESGNPGVDQDGRLRGTLIDTLAGLQPPRASMLLDCATVLQGQLLAVALEVWAALHGPEARVCFRDLQRVHLADCDAKGRLQMRRLLAALARRHLPDRGGSCGGRAWMGSHGLKVAGEPVLAAQLLQSPQQQYHPGCAGRDPEDTVKLSSLCILQLGVTMHELQPAPGDLLHLRWLQVPCADDIILPRIVAAPNLLVLSAHQQQDGKLSAVLPALRQLSVLDLSGSNTLTQLPDALGELMTLRILNLSDCRQLRELPETLSRLTNLQTLDLRGCESLKYLPSSLGVLNMVLHGSNVLIDPGPNKCTEDGVECSTPNPNGSVSTTMCFKGLDGCV